MKNLGDPNNKIWIISSTPKYSDKGMPMTTSIGNSFMQSLIGMGVNRDEIHFDYLVNKVPKSGLRRTPLQQFKESGTLDNEVELLKEKIRMYKPNIIICLGVGVLQHLMGKFNINKWRGHIVWDEDLGCKLMATYDPFHAHSQKQAEKGDKPGQYYVLMLTDLDKAIRNSKEVGITFAEPTYEILDTPTRAKEELRRMLRESKIISYDIEVFQPYEARLIDCIGFSDSLDRAVCIPFYRKSNFGLKRVFSSVDHAEIWCLISELMQSDIPKVAQNSMYDSASLEFFYMTPVNNVIWDTMLIQHQLYCDAPKDLGTLISLYTDLPYHKFMIHSSRDEDRWLYNAADAVANIHVMQGQMKEYYKLEGLPVPDDLPLVPNREFLSIPQVAQYYKVVNPAIKVCIDMYQAGVRVDVDLRERVLENTERMLSELQNALNVAIPYKLHENKKEENTFNPKSTKQKNILFYSILGCKVHTEKGKVSANKKAMAKFLKDPRHYVRTLAEACLSYSEISADILKFKIEPDNGYIRTKYALDGTDTGRLASKGDDLLPASNNLQNIAKGNQRRMIIPEDGEHFLLADLYAAEAFLNALDSNSKNMIEMIEGREEKDVEYKYGLRVMSAETATKYKIHNWMQEETKRMFSEVEEKYNYTYKKAKQTIHGLNYNVQPPMMARESGLPENITTWQYSMYHNKFPGIKLRMQRIVHSVRTKHMLISPLGRRRYFFMPVSSKLFNVAFAWPSQSTIGEVDIIAMNYCHYITKLHNLGLPFPKLQPVLNTHDGLVIRYDRKDEDRAIEELLNSFKVPLTVHNETIIIPVSIGTAPNFNDMVDEKVYFYD